MPRSASTISTRVSRLLAAKRLTFSLLRDEAFVDRFAAVGETRDPIGLAVAAHAHVQRSVGHERETPLRLVDLHGGNPQVEGHAIGSADLQRAEEHARLTVGPGDFVFVRTGAMASARAAGVSASR